MTLLYSIFALITNVLAANTLSDSGVDVSSVDYITISLSSKQTNPTDQNKDYYYISCWLGLIMILLWIVALILIKYLEAKSSQEYDSDTISCSDYSIVVEGLPIDVKQDELQKQLDQYYKDYIKDNSRLPTIWKHPLKIAKVNVGKPFYLSDNALKDEEL